MKLKIKANSTSVDYKVSMDEEELKFIHNLLKISWWNYIASDKEDMCLHLMQTFARVIPVDDNVLDTLKEQELKGVEA